MQVDQLQLDPVLSEAIRLRRLLDEPVDRPDGDRARWALDLFQLCAANADMLKLEDRAREDMLFEFGQCLRVCTNHLPTAVYLTQCQADILLCLRSPTTDVQMAVIKQLIAVIKRDPGTSAQLLTGDSHAIVIAIARLLPIDISLSAICTDFLSALLAIPTSCDRLFAIDSFTHELKAAVKDRDSEGRFRVHDLVVRVSAETDAAFFACDKAGLVDSLVGELNNQDDILTQLTALESLADLCAHSRVAVDRLHEGGVLPRLYQILELTTSGVDAGFLFPGVIRFFGYMAATRPLECAEKYPIFVQSVFTLCLRYHDLDVTQRLLSFDTLCVLGRSPEGKTLLTRHDDKMRAMMAQFARAIASAPQEVRERHLIAMAELFALPLDQQTTDLLAATCRWWLWLDPTNNNYMTTLIKLFKQPIMPVRLATGSVLLALAPQPWAQKIIADAEGLVEFIVDRFKESEHSGRQLKYDLVCALLESPTSEQAFSNGQRAKLSEYRQQGVHHVDVQAEVATQQM